MHAKTRTHNASDVLVNKVEPFIWSLCIRWGGDVTHARHVDVTLLGSAWLVCSTVWAESPCRAWVTLPSPQVDRLDVSLILLMEAGGGVFLRPCGRRSHRTATTRRSAMVIPPTYSTRPCVKVWVPDKATHQPQTLPNFSWVVQRPEYSIEMVIMTPYRHPYIIAYFLSLQILTFFFFFFNF